MNPPCVCYCYYCLWWSLDRDIFGEFFRCVLCGRMYQLVVCFGKFVWMVLLTMVDVDLGINIMVKYQHWECWDNYWNNAYLQMFHPIHEYYRSSVFDFSLSL